MDSNEAAARLAEVHRVNRLSSKKGAWVTSLLVSVAALLIGAVLDLDMIYLSGLVVLAAVGLLSIRSIRPRLTWTDRRGAWLVWGGAALALAAYIAVQFPVRAAGWIAPNTIGALAAVIVILVFCRAGLQRLASASTVVESRKRR
ncbi:hypothetical protein [Pseudoclavibacter sp. VKM Ac-2867]|uniref:hypothetical protein n=1 Tax=Pseudoclavibacter sp. VKM Ac-2867 TaxID=2783829 RepID=UPI001889D3D7|nr:hypothetical protein [Pseudoclavibacter sp. VKM Ac-2867]MBF4460502.1 hypothetical protein [Pseudoclavibacter sp. VKM Ac-2867]